MYMENSDGGVFCRRYDEGLVHMQDISVILVSRHHARTSRLLLALRTAEVIDETGKNVCLICPKRPIPLEKFTGAQVLSPKKDEGLYTLVHRGFERAKKQTVLFLTDSVLLQNAADIAALVQRFRISDFGALSPALHCAGDGSIAYAGANFSTSAFYGYPSTDSSYLHEQADTDVLAGDAFIIKMEAYNKAGGLNAHSYPEQYAVLALCCAMKERGLRCGCAPDLAFLLEQNFAHMERQFGGELVKLAEQYPHFFFEPTAGQGRGFVCPKTFSPQQKGKDRVLLVTHELTCTGAPLLSLDLANELSAMGFCVWFASCKDGPLRQLLTENGYPVLYDEMWEKGRFMPEEKQDCSVPWLLDNVASAFCWTMFNSMATHNMVGRYVGLPFLVYWWIHESYAFWEWGGPLMPALADNINLLSVSRYSQEAMQSVCPQYQSEVLCGFVYDVSPEHLPAPGSGDSIKILMAGTVQSIKGQDVLIRAAMALPVAYQRQLSFYFAGFEADESMVNDNKAFCQMWPQSHYLGYLDRQALYKQMQKIDVALFPSRDDAMSLTGMEAMMFSRVGIYSTNVGISAYIKDGFNGYVFDSGDIEGLKSCLMRMVDERNELKQIGERAHATYMLHFHPDVFHQNIKTLFLTGG